MGRAWRHRGRDRAAQGRNRRDVSHDPDAPGDRGPRRGLGGGHDARALLPGSGNRGEPERARHGGQVASRRRSAGDARGGGQGHPPALAGEVQSHRGAHYTLEPARLYTLPPRPPPIMVAASGPKAARLAGRIGDGFVTTDPDPALLRTFRRAGGRGKPSFVEVTVCWARSERQRGGPRTRSGRWRPSKDPCSRRSPSRPLRGRVQADHGGPSGGGRGLRARPRPASGGDPPGEPSRLPPRLRASGRSRPGGLPPLLRGRDPAPAPSLGAPRRPARPATGCVTPEGGRWPARDSGTRRGWRAPAAARPEARRAPRLGRRLPSVRALGAGDADRLRRGPRRPPR